MFVSSFRPDQYGGSCAMKFNDRFLAPELVMTFSFLGRGVAFGGFWGETPFIFWAVSGSVANFFRARAVLFTMPVE